MQISIDLETRSLYYVSTVREMVPTDNQEGFNMFYHGTSESSAKEIKLNGFNTELVFVTPRKEIAEDFGKIVISVEINEENILVDLDSSGAIGLDVENANAYTGNEDWSINDYIENGYSLCARPEHISIK